MQALGEWEDGLCPGCGMPLDEHDGKNPGHYKASYVACPAVDALDKAQYDLAVREVGSERARRDMTRARQWWVAPKDRIADE